MTRSRHSDIVRMTPQQISEYANRLPDSAWEFFRYSDDGTRAVYKHWIDRETGTFITKEANLIEEQLIRENVHAVNESQHKRFGEYTRVASIPLNVLYRDFPKHLRDNDQDFMKWWLNNPENRMYRTFRGKI